MDTGAAGKAVGRAAINVTPLIDVLLVLLIIFMVIQPTILRGLPAEAAPADKGTATSGQAAVLSIRREGDGATYAVNGQRVPLPELAAQLASILNRQQQKDVFIDGDAALQFSEVATVMNIALTSGAGRIAFVTPREKNAP